MRVSIFREWREACVALPRWVRIICVAVLWLVGLLAAGWAGLSVYEVKCAVPADHARRVFVHAVQITVRQELARTGKLGDLDSELRPTSGLYPNIFDDYRIVVQKTSNGYDVLIKPTGWCFCRPTFILREGGNRIEER